VLQRVCTSHIHCNLRRCVLQLAHCVAMRCHVLPCVAVHCDVLLRVAVCCSTCVPAIYHCNPPRCMPKIANCVAVCCSVLLGVAVCCSVLHRVAVCCSVYVCTCHIPLPPAKMRSANSTLMHALSLHTARTRNSKNPSKCTMPRDCRLVF